MCLKVRKELQAAENDVTCYKVVKQYELQSHLPMAFSLFMDTVIHNEEIAGVSPYTPVTADEGYYIPPSKCIKNMYIHTYADMKGAQACVEEYEKHCFTHRYYKIVIYECFIPRGQKYYVGEDQYTGCMAYASKQIYFKDKLKEIII